MKSYPASPSSCTLFRFVARQQLLLILLSPPPPPPPPPPLLCPSIICRLPLNHSYIFGAAFLQRMGFVEETRLREMNLDLDKWTQALQAKRSPSPGDAPACAIRWTKPVDELSVPPQSVDFGMVGRMPGCTGS